MFCESEIGKDLGGLEKRKRAQIGQWCMDGFGSDDFGGTASFP